TMKKLTLVALLLANISYGQDKLSNDVPAELEKIAGLWVTYEIVDEDGDIDKGLEWRKKNPFQSKSIFASFCESMLLRKDGVYVPMLWNGKKGKVSQDKLMCDGKSSKCGHITYSPDTNMLIFTGGDWPMKFSIIKYDNKELWIKGLEDNYEVLGKSTLKLKKVSG
ncbi:MAG: hypothetical protein AAFX87_09740, partial [Bacteroidota bacterium]